MCYRYHDVGPVFKMVIFHSVHIIPAELDCIKVHYEAVITYDKIIRGVIIHLILHLLVGIEYYKST